MVKNRLLLFFLLVPMVLCHGQSKCDSCLYHTIDAYKRLDIEELSKSIKRVEPLKLRQFFEYELAFLKAGDNVSSAPLNLNSLENEEKVIAKILLGNFINRDNSSKTDTIAFALFREAYEESLQIGNPTIKNEVLRKINSHLFLFKESLDTYMFYADLYTKNAVDSVDSFYSKLHEVGYQMLKYDKTPTAVPDSILSFFWEKFDEMEAYATHPFHFATVNNYKGIIYSACLGDQENASRYYEKAISFYKKTPYFFSQQGLIGVEYNLATILFENGRFEESIRAFKDILKKEKELRYRVEAYDWIQRAYDSLGDYKNTHRYFVNLVHAKDSINLLDKSKFIADLERKYDFKEKEAELDALAKNNELLMNKQNILIPILLGVFALASIVFVLYRKYRNKSDVLEGEQSETLKRLDEIKKIVIKNHIVLKDKRKVYVADLMYIRSEDHYLNLFLNDGNNYFVRGRLKDIKEELPPNFIQCHRSYIVNRNFVKQQLATVLLLLNGERVPVSRGYKENL